LATRKASVPVTDPGPGRGQHKGTLRRHPHPFALLPCGQSFALRPPVPPLCRQLIPRPGHVVTAPVTPRRQKAKRGIHQKEVETGGFMTKSFKGVLAELATTHKNSALQGEGISCRVSWAAEAVLAFLERCPGDDRDATTVFTDLMADMFHLGQHLHIAGVYADFPLWRQTVLLTAMGHFDAETIASTGAEVRHPDAAFALLTYINSRKQHDQHISVAASLLATELVLLSARLEPLSNPNALTTVIAEVYK
uniref:hypothetical protein n=3 Tax=Serratia TaxID=613 RepID=UPI001F4C39C0